MFSFCRLDTFSFPNYFINPFTMLEHQTLELQYFVLAGFDIFDPTQRYNVQRGQTKRSLIYEDFIFERRTIKTIIICPVTIWPQQIQRRKRLSSNFTMLVLDISSPFRSVLSHFFISLNLNFFFVKCRHYDTIKI